MKKLAVRGKAYRLNLFDTVSISSQSPNYLPTLPRSPLFLKKAGQERFRTLSTSYYRGAHGVIIVYDICSRKSFLSMERWIEEARSNASPDAVIYLVCFFFFTRLLPSSPFLLFFFSYIIALYVFSSSVSFYYPSNVVYVHFVYKFTGVSIYPSMYPTKNR